MKNPPPTQTDDTPVIDAPRTRRCLRCQTSFESEWAGERICSSCKRSVAWRKGAPIRAHAVNRQR